ncbi:MAG: RibD family protein [Leptospiraceae bacterium]|nr:RibD family protein [Leptospiraceae bacterium]
MKPYIFLNMAMTLDGKVARPDGKWYGLNTRSDKTKMDIIRSKADALIVGKSSIINDDPEVKIRYAKHVKSPRPVVLLQTSSLPRNRKIFSEKPILFCTSANHSKIQDELGDLAEVHCISENPIITPSAALEKLTSLKFQSILLEGGPRLNHSFLKENLIDKLYITIVPYLIGKKSLPAIVDGDTEFMDFDKLKWKLISMQNENNEIFLEYIKGF